jgi:hypothetical protein
MWDENEPPGERVLVSYLTLRRMVGGLGIALPFLVVAWGSCLAGKFEIRPSISDYYHTSTGDLFVGILFTIAWFLFAYRGPERKDDIAGDLAAVFALGVALLPHDAPSPWGTLHFLSAAALFLVLTYFSMALFTKTGGTKAQMTGNKVIRNRLYTTCGVAMLGCIVAIGIYKLWLGERTLFGIPPIWLFETLALEAFGISWMVKGETVWAD